MNGQQQPTNETVTWLKLATRRVISLYVEALARSHGWQKLYIVSPWISPFDAEAGMAYSQFLKRLKDDGATAYVVSRPPVESWHREALRGLAATGRANIVLLPELHTKLFWAETDHGNFALVGSANLTQMSLTNREIGVLIRGSGAGAPLVKRLAHEGAEIYRSHGRQVMCNSSY